MCVSEVKVNKFIYTKLLHISFESYFEFLSYIIWLYLKVNILARDAFY